MAYGKAIELFLVNGTAESLIIGHVCQNNKLPGIENRISRQRKRSGCFAKETLLLTVTLKRLGLLRRSNENGYQEVE